MRSHHPRSEGSEDRAISPVVGTVLLVGITVVLVGVVAVTVLGFGDGLDRSTAQVSFEYEYDDGADTLTITHRGGETLPADEVSLKWGGKTVVWGDVTGASDLSSGSSIVLGQDGLDADGNGVAPPADTDDLVGSEEKVFVVHQPQPEEAMILGRWQLVDD
ncbi:type IV pilin [Halapricum salinum]|nr:type IV pilin N-terminal domain-containing protein [Halapricum salinum]